MGRIGLVTLGLVILALASSVVDGRSRRRERDLLAQRVARLEALLAPASLVHGGRTLRFTGVNVQIVSGAGETGGWPPNGLGNLIVGYNESRGICDRQSTPTCDDPVFEGCGDEDPPDCYDRRGGSHNLILGRGNNYEGFGALVFGELNNAEGQRTAILGGRLNSVAGEGSVIVAGAKNRADGPDSLVAGGRGNYTGATYSFVGGGNSNRNTGSLGAMLGGTANVANGNYSVVTGGAYNQATGESSVVGGGRRRQANGEADWVAGSLLQDE